jgi:hypothetical protein
MRGASRSRSLCGVQGSSQVHTARIAAKSEEMVSRRAAVRGTVNGVGDYPADSGVDVSAASFRNASMRLARDAFFSTRRA